jgi:hypothetical protein
VREAHADLAAGSEVRSVLIRERQHLDNANARVERCAAFHDDLRSRFSNN